MAHVHSQVNVISRTYFYNEKRFNYTTPKSFLEQISLYSKLLRMQFFELSRKVERLKNGLDKLKKTASQVYFFHFSLQIKYFIINFILRILIYKIIFCSSTS